MLPIIITSDFDKQLEIAEKLYGQKIKFYFTGKDVERIIASAHYSEEIKRRVEKVILGRMRRYQYLF